MDKEKVTIYPDKKLLKKIDESAKENKRSRNNEILFQLEKNYDKSIRR